MIQRTLVLLLCCISQIIFAQSQVQTGITITNSTTDEVHLHFFDEFNDLTGISILPGKNEYIETDIPIIIYISNFNNDPFLLLPGDSVTMSQVKGRITCTSASIIRNNELSILKNLKDVTKPVFTFNDSIKTLKRNGLLMRDINAGDSVFGAEYTRAKSYLDTLITRVRPSKELQSIFVRYNYYSYLENRASLLNTKAFSSPLNSQLVIETLVNLKSKLNCDDCLFIDSYRKFALNYLYYLERVVTIEDIYKYISDTFTGSTKTFMLFNLMRGYANNNRFAFNRHYDIFLKDSQNKKFNDYVVNLKIDESNKIAKTSIISPVGIKTDFEELIAKNKGKVIYIDFWASWCIPCIEELPFSKKLSGMLNGKVTFIYLSLDKNKNLWLKDLKSLKVDTSRHFLVEENFNSELARRLTIKTIPRYVIINRQGKIFTKDALRPSDKRLFEILKKM